MSLDPIKTTQVIRENYTNYLLTTFRLGDEELQAQFEEELGVPHRFVKGPILEATPPFAKANTLQQLTQEGLLCAEFRQLQSPRLPLDRPLYHHQQTVIEKILRYQRNVVVATGTGSGKTETFLIPILDRLFRQKLHRSLTPGVRALLLYPMNALANDQLTRLRELLDNYPSVTFGRYTGETERDHKAAEDKY